MSFETKLEMEEGSFYDICCVLKKNMVLFWGVVFAAVLLGLVVTISKPATYNFTQLMRVAGYGLTSNLQNSDVVLGELQNVIIPNMSTSSLVKRVSFIVLDNDISKTYLLFQATGTLTQKADYQAIFNTIQNDLNSYEKPLLNLTSKKMENQMLLSKKQYADIGKTADDSSDFQIGDSASSHRLMTMEYLQNLQSEIEDSSFYLSTVKPSHFVGALNQKEVSISKIKLFLLFIVVGFLAACLTVFIKDIWIKSRIN